MADAAHFNEDMSAASITQSQTSWGLEIGRHQLRVTRTTEARTLAAPPHALRKGLRRSSGHVWPLAIGTFASVSAFGLLVFGAIASVPSLPRRGYALSVPVPPRIGPGRRKPHRRRPRIAASSSSIRFTDSIVSGTRFDAADEPYVAMAMRSGDLQEWSGPDGERRFLSVGPERTEGDGRCRDLVLLVRRKDGESQTQDGWRCMAYSKGQGAVRSAALVRPEMLGPTAAVTKQDADLAASLYHVGNDASATF